VLTVDPEGPGRLLQDMATDLYRQPDRRGYRHRFSIGRYGLRDRLGDSALPLWLGIHVWPNVWVNRLILLVCVATEETPA
jgi:hypothetical protein